MLGHFANSSSDVTIREATLADIPEILRQRRGMYIDMNYKDNASLEAMVKCTAPYLEKAIADGSFRAWLACKEDRPVAGGAVVISPWPAHPYDLECRSAHHPEHLHRSCISPTRSGPRPDADNDRPVPPRRLLTRYLTRQ